MHRLRDDFFEAGKAQSLSPDPEERAKSNCWLCRGEIDYTVGAGTTDDSHTLDHVHAVDDRPDLQEDPENFRHAHYSCNSSRGKRAPNDRGLGKPMPAWW